MARKYETDYRIAKTDEVLGKANATALDIDLRLDAIERAVASLGSGADTLVTRVLRVIETEISPRAAEIEALLTDYREGVPASVVAEEPNGRQFLTPARRAAILAELRGGVDASGDTLAKLLAMIVALDAAKATPSNIAAAVTALKGGVAADYDTLAKIVALIATKATPADITATISALPSIGYRNRIVNGAFFVNQRGVSGTVTLAAGAYGHDRWKAGTAGCVYTISTSGIDIVITIISGSLLQVIAAEDVEGGVYTASWSGTASGRVYQGAATGSYSGSGIVTPELIAATDVKVEFSLGTVTRVQLEPGGMATTFERVSVADQVRRCLRYFQTIRAYRVKGVSFGQALLASGDLIVPMRVSPQLALLNNNAVVFHDGVAPLSGTLTIADQRSTTTELYMQLGGVTSAGSYGRAVLGFYETVVAVADAEL
ncbi:hypothetical protein [Rhodopseudomonas parapalustris]